MIRGAAPRDAAAARRLAEAGEAAAARYLEARGYRILGVRLRTPYGDIDVLARDAGVVVFVEVKTRRSDRFGRPAESVDPRKQACLRRSAESLRRSRPELAELPCRFDVLEVVWPAGAEPRIVHLADAFV